MLPLVFLLDKIVGLYVIIIFIRALLSWFPGMRYKHYGFVRWLEKITDPVLVPFQKLLPPGKTGGLDLSPLLAILAIRIVWSIIAGILIGR